MKDKLILKLFESLEDSNYTRELHNRKFCPTVTVTKSIKVNQPPHGVWVIIPFYHSLYMHVQLSSGYGSANVDLSIQHMSEQRRLWRGCAYDITASEGSGEAVHMICTASPEPSLFAYAISTKILTRLK